MTRWQTKRGRDREVDVMAQLQEDGWVCASRRHITGAGDILAVCLDRKLLIEVKTTAGGPFERFGPSERRALIDTAAKVGATPLLAHWPPGGQLKLLHRNEWPTVSLNGRYAHRTA